MRIIGSVNSAIVLFLCLLAPACTNSAQAASRAENAVADASQQGKFTFVMFFRQKDTTTDAMAAALKQNLADKADSASITYVHLGDPAEQGLVKKYGVARAPMPLTIALAPNGAITAISPRSIDAAKVNEAFVSPASAESLKSLQAQKLVFVAIHDASNSKEPSAIAAFANDPHFSNRMAVISLNASDPNERDFAEDLQLGTDASSRPALVVLAPPGVVVGKFSATSTKDEIAAAIAAAGKCCDDPNCKHHK